MQEVATPEQEITIPEIHPDEVIDFMNIDETDFSSFTMAQQIRHFRGGRLCCAARHVRCRTHSEAQSGTR